MPLTLDIPGASPADIRCGVAAAKAILDMYGVDPDQAIGSVLMVLERYDNVYSLEDGTPLDLTPTEEDEKIFSIWCKAENAAIRACCGDAENSSGSGVMWCSSD
ncbi:hypothetical protein N7E70_007240 [Aminobacter sp. NyZ550]|uniref:hypothetical protein n=1 Tax=Aminobacter sp. NyZ550 TaxID=2979870 RepID=UPI0021D5F59D|nr:hypothetical protein [Aminobacter sp. NyZ550]WAX96647.1 hypothetical protein N7E70_007240 [Aminobacter sp. NyZ550]